MLGLLSVKVSAISVGCTSITGVPNRQSFFGLICRHLPRGLRGLHNEILGHNGAEKSNPPLCSPLLSFSSIILRWRVECSTAGRFLLLQGELRKQSRASVMLLSLQGGEEMSCAQLKMIIWEPGKQASPLEDANTRRSPWFPPNEFGLADVPPSWTWW